MATFEGTIYSDALRMMTSITVSIPQVVEGDMPVLYLLHGLSDNHSAWLRRSNVDLYAEKSGFAVVMPEVQRSFYTDMAYGLRYFTYIADELPKICCRLFRFSDKRENKFIAGLSMGGYGAMKAALTYPDRYLAAASFSGALHIKKSCKNSSDLISYQECYGINHVRISEDDDLFSLAEMMKTCGEYPDFYITCGLADFLYEDNRDFCLQLEKLSVPYKYEEWEGAHNWEFWNESIRRAILHFAKIRSEQ